MRRLMFGAAFFRLLFTLAVSYSVASAQNNIRLKNPSFDQGIQGAGVTPEGWINLGPADETPPDIQPGYFGVDMPAQDGRWYLGLSVRETNTWEGVGQVLGSYLRKGSSYRFSVWLARSNSMKSRIRTQSEPANFNAPTVLKIWGYNAQTQEEELLAESEPVSHSQWIRYEFVLSPTNADFNELDLMAYYAPGHTMENGNLLIDNCSEIVKIEK